MRRNKIAVAILFLLIAAIFIVFQFVLQSDGTEVTFGSGCTDIVDLWSGMSLEERVEACASLVGFPGDPLENYGFSPQDCQFQESYGESCGDIGALGTRLVCVYACKK